MNNYRDNTRQSQFGKYDASRLSQSEAWKLDTDVFASLDSALGDRPWAFIGPVGWVERGSRVEIWPGHRRLVEFIRVNGTHKFHALNQDAMSDAVFNDVWFGSPFAHA